MGDNRQPGVPSTYTDREQFVIKELVPTFAQYMRWNGLMFIANRFSQIETYAGGDIGLCMPTSKSRLIEPFFMMRVEPPPG